MTPLDTSDHGLSSEEWERRLAALWSSHTSDGDKWLQLLYSSYLQRFLSDNNRVWSMGQWMVPASLAPLAAVSIFPKQPTFMQAILLATPSILLIWTWLITSENHVAFQENSMIWLKTIEKLLGVDKPGGPKVSAGLLLIRPGLVRKMRWTLAGGITAIWIFILIFTVANSSYKLPHDQYCNQECLHYESWKRTQAVDITLPTHLSDRWQSWSTA